MVLSSTFPGRPESLRPTVKDWGSWPPTLEMRLGSTCSWPTIRRPTFCSSTRRPLGVRLPHSSRTLWLPGALTMPTELGSFFSRQQLGRGLARLDFNGDGREDFVVTHLDQPAALVANCTLDGGHFFALRLAGVECNRDAVGTIVRVAAGGRTRWKQLTAGDGYQASNQRQLIFGLGEHTMIDHVIVRWPTGREQKFLQVAADAEYILVEGRPEM